MRVEYVIAIAILLRGHLEYADMVAGRRIVLSDILPDSLPETGPRRSCVKQKPGNIRFCGTLIRSDYSQDYSDASHLVSSMVTIFT